MKAVNFMRSICLVLVGGLIFTLNAAAQENVPPKRERIASAKDEKKADGELRKLDAPETFNQMIQDDKSLRREGLSEEESAIVPYYNNYLKEYRLGPQDVISIEVFGQCPDYCKTGITVPPTAKISYPLIREGVFVGGKTVEQIQEEVMKKLDEYIIDPKVTVTLDKVGSARYSVLGDVAAPGVKLMERRLSVYEAIVESGGILRTGDRKKVVIYRQTQTGIAPLAVNLEEIARGKAEMIYLVPGDQIVVPGNKIKTVEKVLDIFSKFSIVRLLFGSPI